MLLSFSAMAQGKPKLDGAILIPQGAPPLPVAGQLYVSNVNYHLYQYDGSQWIDLTSGLDGMDLTTNQTAAGIKNFVDGVQITTSDGEYGFSLRNTDVPGYQMNSYFSNIGTLWHMKPTGSVLGIRFDFNQDLWLFPAETNFPTPTTNLQASNKLYVDNGVQEAKDYTDTQIAAIPGGSDNSLSEADQTIADGVTRVVNAENTGYISYRQGGTEIMRVGGNNDEAIRVSGLEAVPGNTFIDFVSAPRLPYIDVSVSDPSAYAGVIVRSDDSDEDMYYSNGQEWIKLTNRRTTFKDITTSTYTLLASDASDYTKLRFNNASNVTVSAPASPVDGQTFRIVQYGVGKVETDFLVNVSVDSTLYASTTGPGDNLIIEYDQANTRWDITGKYEAVADVTAPSVPTGLNSTGQGETTIDIAWTASSDNVGVDHYDVSVDDGAATNVGNVTSYQITGLTADTEYQIKVRAVDAAGNASAYTTSIAVSTAAASNLYTLANAANPDNEVDATTGVTSSGGEFTISSVSTPTADTGTYSLQFEKTTAGGVNASAEIEVTGLTAGVSHTITVKGYVSTPGDANNNYIRTSGATSADWSVSNQVEIDPGAAFVEYSFVSTPVGTTGRIEIASSTAAVNVVGTTIHIDSITIVETP